MSKELDKLTMSKELDKLTKAVLKLSTDFQRLSRQYLRDSKKLQVQLARLEKRFKKYPYARTDDEQTGQES